MPPREPSLAPVEGFIRESSGDRAAAYIRRLIFDGELRPGTRVPQDDIARTLGVSRIPVREALIALERDGWVTIELHRGAFVNALSATAVQDHYDLYGLFYGLAAQRAMERTEIDLVAALQAIARELRATSDTAEFGRLAFEFHRTVVHEAHSPRIKVALRALAGLVPGDFFAFVPAAMDVERKGIAEIIRAMKKGDSEEVRSRYARMMHRIGREVVRRFDERGLFSLALP